MAALPLGDIATRADAERLLEPAISSPMVRQWALQNLLPNKLGGENKFRWRHNIQVLNNIPEQLAGFELSGPPSQYHGPTLFFRGLRSPYVNPERHGPIIRALFPMATIEGIDAEHWLHHERPHEFIDKVPALN